MTVALSTFSDASQCLACWKCVCPSWEVTNDRCVFFLLDREWERIEVTEYLGTPLVLNLCLSYLYGQPL